MLNNYFDKLGVDYVATTLWGYTPDTDTHEELIQEFRENAFLLTFVKDFDNHIVCQFAVLFVTSHDFHEAAVLPKRLTSSQDF